MRSVIVTLIDIIFKIFVEKEENGTLWGTLDQTRGQTLVESSISFLLKSLLANVPIVVIFLMFLMIYYYIYDDYIYDYYYCLNDY